MDKGGNTRQEKQRSSHFWLHWEKTTDKELLLREEEGLRRTHVLIFIKQNVSLPLYNTLQAIDHFSVVTAQFYRVPKC